MKYTLFVLLILISLIGYADIYMQTDKNGNTTYSDVPTSDKAIKIAAPETNTTTSTTSATTPSNASAEVQTFPSNQIISTQAKKPYTTFVIISPADQATIQNQPTISVNVSVTPNLQEGDAVQIYLDGSPWGKSLPATQFTFTAPERGTHQISARLVDKNGQTLKGNTKQYHLYSSGSARRISTSCGWWGLKGVKVQVPTTNKLTCGKLGGLPLLTTSLSTHVAECRHVCSIQFHLTYQFETTI